MYFKTYKVVILLFVCLIMVHCGQNKQALGGTENGIPTERQRAKDQKNAEKEAVKGQKEAVKRFWSMQTKDVKKRVKQTNKRQSRNKKDQKARDKGKWDAF